jgi:hypothetical protein
MAIHLGDVPDPSDMLATAREFHMAEYGALRAEILKRSETQHQLISLALIASGSLLAIGSQGATTALLAYPVLSLFLAVSWAQQQKVILRISQYIREHIESEMLPAGQGWETSVFAEEQPKRRSSFSALSAQGIFVLSQILTLVLTIFKTGGPSFLQEQLILILIDCLVVALTVVILSSQRLEQ